LSRKERLFAALKVAGLDPSVATFEERKKVQKLVYLLQFFGVRLGFQYNWYLHGPYSPDLTKVLFEGSGDSGPVHISTELTGDEAKRIQKLRQFLGDRIRSTDFLELLVSLDYIKKEGASPSAKKEDVIRVLREKKPFFTDREILDCWERLTEVEALTS